MPISRRRFLTQTIGFSAAALLAGRVPAALAEAAVNDRFLQPAGPAAHLLAIGDFGVKKADLSRQRAVADGMARYLARESVRPDALALLGDNFYGGLGRAGADSSRWHSNIESMYPAQAFPCPMYAMLGNHDYRDGGGSVAAQLEYSRRGSRWTLPAKWYRFELAAGERPVATVLVIDTNFVFSGGLSRAERQKQGVWLADQLSAKRSTPFVFVLGHHPVYSGGSHGDTRALVEHLDPLLRRHKVDLYLCGHDHDLQHIEYRNHPTSFVVSGAGGARARESRERKGGAFARAVYGFTHLELRPDRFIVRHVDANGATLHAFTKSTEGRVTPRVVV
jgi:predicted MPP superfamily phosphohydrolase